MPSPNALRSPLQRRNVTWPILRRGKGWHTQTMEARYAAAVREAVRVARGQYPWAPDFGSTVFKARGQNMNKALEVGLEQSVRESIERHVPDVTVLSVDANREGPQQRLQIRIVWAILASGPIGSSTTNFAAGPVADTIEV